MSKSNLYHASPATVKRSKLKLSTEITDDHIYNEPYEEKCQNEGVEPTKIKSNIYYQNREN